LRNNLREPGSVRPCELESVTDHPYSCCRAETDVKWSKQKHARMSCLVYTFVDIQMNNLSTKSWWSVKPYCILSSFEYAHHALCMLILFAELLFCGLFGLNFLTDTTSQAIQSHLPHCKSLQLLLEYYFLGIVATLHAAIISSSKNHDFYSNSYQKELANFLSLKLSFGQFALQWAVTLGARIRNIHQQYSFS